MLRWRVIFGAFFRGEITTTYEAGNYFLFLFFFENILHFYHFPSTHMFNLFCFYMLIKGKAVPIQAWTGPEGSRKLRFPDFMATAQDGGRLSALCTGRLYPQEIHLVLITVRG